MTATLRVPPTARTLSHGTGAAASPDQHSSVFDGLGNHTYACQPARSSREDWAPLLAREVSVRWLKPHGLDLPWLRETRGTIRSCGSATFAITIDSRGRVARVFNARRDDLAAYAAGFGRCSGAAGAPMTCPLEGVSPRSIQVGQPSEPAHRMLSALCGAGIGLGAVFPLWFTEDGRLREEVQP